MKEKKIIIMALAIVFSFYSCTEDEQNNNKNISPLVSMSIDSIKSIVIGKWQAISVSGVSGPTDAKDSTFYIFTDNSYYEFYQKDSLPRRDIYEIKYDKSKYYNDSNWYIIFHGFPYLIEDSSNSTGYGVIDGFPEEIITLNDSILELHFDPFSFSSTYKKIK